MSGLIARPVRAGGSGAWPERLYALAAGLATPGLRLMLRRRLGRGKEIAARLPERRGVDATPRPPGRLLWLHAASVGETVSVLPVLAALDPEWHVLLTTGTVTSAALLGRRLPAMAKDHSGLDRRVLHRFVPLDVPRWTARFLDHWRPDVAAFVESELWPNLLAGCRSRGIPTALVNARMSERSARRWRRLPGLAARMLGGFDTVQAQSEPDATRLRALGARDVSVAGDLKFAAPALPFDAAELATLQAAVGGRPIWLAASTHPGEEVLAAEVHRALADRHPGLITIIAPRHPERGPAIAAALGGAARRAGGEGPPAGGIWIADTMGELGLLYRLAGIAFIGKSLTGRGGQNVLEPARLGCAIAVGRHTANFTAAVGTLEAVGALTRVADAAALAQWVDALLVDPARRLAGGRAAREAADRHAGLPALTARRLEALARPPAPECRD
ncbi:MAG TPA: 3-deoxy-D-manno-octulosonic acid transferase [Acetobacteraceae bacterium]|nr:3-deoxy-D-manno-octulosonic acid transferase [Acetobacteraceae bacterium]